MLLLLLNIIYHNIFHLFEISVGFNFSAKERSDCVPFAIYIAQC